MAKATRRPIGRILTDGGLISKSQLEKALAEQKRTNELLGEVLVRLGMLDGGELRAALAIQEHLGTLEQALGLAAGMRQLLGSLLVDSGILTESQLELALARQKRGGKKLGEVCLELGFVSKHQLDALLLFQEQQERCRHGVSPLRLGQLLVVAGCITADQLDQALLKQASSGKKLGEVLVEEGYATHAHVHQGMRLQRLLISSVLAAILSLSSLTMSGCGSAGGEGTVTAPKVAASTSVAAIPAAAPFNYFNVTQDDYGFIKPNFLYSSDNDAFWSIQANVARNVTDIDTRAVYRIDIPKDGATLPQLNRTYAIEDGSSFEKFPGSFVLFNGESSTNRRAERGTISFFPDSNASGTVSGTFDVTWTDYNAGIIPAPEHHLTGAFRYVIGSYGPASAGV